MSLAMMEVDEQAVANEENLAASASEAETGKPHPCFAENEFGNILRVLAEDDAEG